MHSAILTLFDLTALSPNAPPICYWCSREPATTRVYAIQNLLGLHRTELAANAYRRAFHRAHSGPCCSDCARDVASAWWSPTHTCPNGTCHLWGHTLAEPRPGWDCTRHHRETTVVWNTPQEAAT